MRRQAFARRPFGTLDLDLCFGCRAIWFDQYESAALTPGAILELFRIIYENHDAPPQPVSDAARCPVCRERLKLTHDIQRTNQIVYHRCPQGHGRLTAFIQFLREKEFVRSLTLPEIARLKVTVTQVRCSSCGAPVSLERDAQCAHCHAPISILDADAVRRTLAELDEKERSRKQVDPAAAIDALLAGKRIERKMTGIETRSSWGLGPLDLVHEALGFLTDL